jgi:hypothetical protein
MQIRRIAAAASVAATLALAGPAVAGHHHPDDPPEPCPDGYVLTFDLLNITGADENGNGMVCARTLPTGGDVFTDDRI